MCLLCSVDRSAKPAHAGERASLRALLLVDARSIRSINATSSPPTAVRCGAVARGREAPRSRRDARPVSTGTRRRPCSG